ncbi:MAG: hypothetical protein J0L66_11645 [Cytophagales bacterium]|nr:hypothetical protein [Cytophagales bacterium]
MKILKLLFLFVLPTLGYCQSDVPIPEFKNTIALLQNGALANLERLTPAMETKHKGFSADVLFTVDGTTSNVRLNANNLQFVFKMLDTETDPSTVVKLLKVVPTKNKRTIKQTSMSSFGSKKVKEDVYALSFKKVESGVYIISPVESALESGEYVLQVPLNYQEQASLTLSGVNVIWFGFGID